MKGYSTEGQRFRDVKKVKDGCKKWKQFLKKLIFFEQYSKQKLAEIGIFQTILQKKKFDFFPK